MVVPMIKNPSPTKQTSNPSTRWPMRKTMSSKLAFLAARAS